MQGIFKIFHLQKQKNTYYNGKKSKKPLTTDRFYVIIKNTVEYFEVEGGA